LIRESVTLRNVRGEDVEVETDGDLPMRASSMQLAKNGVTGSRGFCIYPGNEGMRIDCYSSLDCTVAGVSSSLSRIPRTGGRIAKMCVTTGIDVLLDGLNVIGRRKSICPAV
jgi:hypothetical protein